MGLYSDLFDAKAIVEGGNPSIPKARRFIAATIDRAMSRMIDAERLASRLLQQEQTERDAKKSAKKILASFREESTPSPEGAATKGQE